MSQPKIKNQKIIRVGNSLAVTLNKEWLDRCGLKEGDDLISRYNEEDSNVTFATPVTYKAIKPSGAMTLAEKKAVYRTKIDPEFVEWVEKTLKEDEVALKELANL